MMRTNFSLDGTWAFWPAAEDGKTQDPSAALPTTRAPHTLTVPGVWQAQDDLRFHQGIGWYQTEFDAPELAADQRLYIHFGAVDWFADVWVNGAHVGAHENGYLPFEVDASPALRSGRNVLTVRVADPIELFHALPHGKQSWYGLMSGIWQPVRAEVRNVQSIASVRVLTNDATANVTVALNTPLQAGQRISWILTAPDGSIADASIAGTLEFSIEVPNPALWDIGAGNIYTLDVALQDGSDTTIDSVVEHFGFRTITTSGGKILLNGKPYYMRGALDQDYYPDTDSVPPSQEFIEEQFQLALDMGFNCMRVHIKVADPRYYYAADKVGMLIWTEIPNWATFSAAAAQRGEETMYGMVARDWNHPSVLIRTVINESWGIDLTVPEQRAWLAATVQKLRDADPSRLVVGNSACCANFQVDTDIEDFHMYMAMPDKHIPWRKWVENFASRPAWTYAHEYTTFEEWQKFTGNQKEYQSTPAPENVRRGDEPLLLSEFGNWGLPDVEQLLAGYGGEEPWWFEQGSEWGNGEVYPHGIESRFNYYGLRRAFPTLAALTAASRFNQGEAMKFEIEQIRRNAPIQGYIVTEWSDLNWECNGMVDMQRNPKEVLLAMRAVNQDTVLIPEWERLAYSAGESVRVPILVSHYGDALADGCALVWTLDGTDQSGIIPAATPVAYEVVEAGVVEVELPLVNAITRARLAVRLLDGTQGELATTYLDLLICPALDAPYARRVASPDVASALTGAGYTVEDEGDIIITNTLTDELRQYMIDGGRVLLLAEADDAIQTHAGNLHIVARHHTPWQGDWASSGLWITQDKCFEGVSETGMMDFTFADLTPRHVIAGVAPIDYMTRVHAGLFVGWVHKGIPTVTESRVGRGVLLVSTLRLLPNLESNPLARVLLAQMVNYLANLKHVY